MSPHFFGIRWNKSACLQTWTNGYKILYIVGDLQTIHDKVQSSHISRLARVFSLGNCHEDR